MTLNKVIITLIGLSSIANASIMDLEKCKAPEEKEIFGQGAIMLYQANVDRYNGCMDRNLKRFLIMERQKQILKVTEDKLKTLNNLKKK